MHVSAPDNTYSMERRVQAREVFPHAQNRVNPKAELHFWARLANRLPSSTLITEAN